ncbi:hypothetical protein WJX82_010847 [Trebouxia sp. C0006]
MPRSSLQLDSTKSNPLFDNWKLARGLSVSEEHVTLEGHVTVLDHSTEYLNTRAAVLHNHLNYSGGRFFVFKTHDGIDSLCEVSSGQQVGLRKAVWEQSYDARKSCASQQTAHSALQPSVAIIQSLQSPEEKLIVSSGRGDLILLDGGDPQGPCFPLQSSESSTGARSIHIEAAFQQAPGHVQVVAWAVKQKQGSESAGCEIFLISLEHDKMASGTALTVKAVELLQVSALPPHAVMVQPLHGLIIIAASNPETQRQSCADPPVQAIIADGDGDDDVDSMSPRTLRQAADRLARFTSDQPADDAVPRNEFTDLYNEASMPPPAGDLRQHNAEQPVYRLADQVECDPHKVVAIRPGQQQQILLGMSNDVDCAVVGFKSSNSALVSDHIHTIPALAFVAAGKIHKKFTLLGHPESRLAAAVIEGHRFSYVYKHTTGRQWTGDSQIIDMGLEEKSAAVLGAALVWQDGQDQLFILVPDQLLVYTIKA